MIAFNQTQAPRSSAAKHRRHHLLRSVPERVGGGILRPRNRSWQPLPAPNSHSSSLPPPAPPVYSAAKTETREGYRQAELRFVVEPIMPPRMDGSVYQLSRPMLTIQENRGNSSSLAPHLEESRYDSIARKGKVICQLVATRV